MPRDAEQRTLTGTMLEDVRDRLEGQVLTPGVPLISPLFYNEDARFVPTEASDTGPRSEKFYRVDLRLVRPVGQQLPTNAEELLAALVELSWPIDPQSGESISERPIIVHQTFFLNTLTGPDWTEIDPDYEPKIES